MDQQLAGAVGTSDPALYNLSMNSTLTAGLVSSVGWYDYFPNQLAYHYWPETRFTTVVSKNTFEQAFKVVSKLIENETIKDIKLKDFIKLVKEVEELL